MRALAVLLAAGLLGAWTPPECGKGYRKDEACTPTGPLTLRAEEAFSKLWAIWTVSATGSPDSVIVLIHVSGIATDVRKKYTSGTAKTDSVDVGYPAAGTVKTVSALAVAFKLGKSSDTVSLGSATVTGDVPAPAGNFKLSPASFTVQAGKTVRLTATGT